MKGHIWTEEENQVLKNYASNNISSGHVSWTNINQFLPGLSARLCTAHYSRINQKPLWTKEENELLLEIHDETTSAQLVSIFSGRSVTAINA